MTTVTNTNSAATATAAEQSRTRLSGNFDTFLKLLTQQLQHQDPLEPMDTNEFTQQLVQYANVEQSIAANSNLEKLVKAQGTNVATGALGYLGKTVDAEGDKLKLVDGQTAFQFLADKNYEKVTATVYDSKNKAVRVVEVPKDKGVHQLVWNGRDDAGNKLPDGDYRVRVDASSTDGTSKMLSTLISGKVESVGTDNGEIMLTVNGLPIAASTVIAVHEPDRAS